MIAPYLFISCYIFNINPATKSNDVIDVFVIVHAVKKLFTSIAPNGVKNGQNGILAIIFFLFKYY